jgi:RNA polymerase sigma-70 factor (ECF subfamily)
MALTQVREEQFHEFVRVRSSALLRIAFLLSGDVTLAEDLLQTALSKTYLAWRRLDGMDSVEAYTRRVLMNTATSWWRRRWRAEQPTSNLPECSIMDQSQVVVDRDAMWRALATLPARQRAVIVLRYYEDLTEAEAAAQLGVSVGTVKSQSARALSTLRERLGGEGRRPASPRIGLVSEAVEEAK